MSHDLYGDGALWKLRWSQQVEEMRMWRNLVCLLRFAVKVPPGERPSAYTPEVRPLRVMQFPTQRSNTAVAAEDRLFKRWPGTRSDTTRRRGRP